MMVAGWMQLAGGQATLPAAEGTPARSRAASKGVEEEGINAGAEKVGWARGALPFFSCGGT